MNDLRLDLVNYERVLEETNAQKINVSSNITSYNVVRLQPFGLASLPPHNIGSTFSSNGVLLGNSRSMNNFLLH